MGVYVLYVMATSNPTQDAIDACTRVSVEAAIQNTAPLADFDEFRAASDAADEVTA